MASWHKTFSTLLVLGEGFHCSRLSRFIRLWPEQTVQQTVELHVFEASWSSYDVTVMIFKWVLRCMLFCVCFYIMLLSANLCLAKTWLIYQRVSWDFLKRIKNVWCFGNIKAWLCMRNTLMPFLHQCPVVGGQGFRLSHYKTFWLIGA